MEKLICPKCHIEYSDAHNFCSKCGSKLTINPEWKKIQDQANQKLSAEEKKAQEVRALYKELLPIKKPLYLFLETYPNANRIKDVENIYNLLSNAEKGDYKKALDKFSYYEPVSYIREKILNSDVYKCFNFVKNDKENALKELNDMLYELKNINISSLLRGIDKYKTRTGNLAYTYEEDFPQMYKDAATSIDVFKYFFNGGKFTYYEGVSVNYNLVFKGADYVFEDSLERRIYNLVARNEFPIDASHALALKIEMSSWLSFLKAVEERGPNWGSFYPPFSMNDHHIVDGAIGDARGAFLLTAKKK